MVYGGGRKNGNLRVVEVRSKTTVFNTKTWFLLS